MCNEKILLFKITFNERFRCTPCDDTCNHFKKIVVIEFLVEGAAQMTATDVRRFDSMLLLYTTHSKHLASLSVSTPHQELDKKKPVHTHRPANYRSRSATMATGERAASIFSSS